MIVRFKHLAQPRFLRRVSRKLLMEFLSRFADDLSAANLTLPRAIAAPDGTPTQAGTGAEAEVNEEALAKLAEWFANPERLPGPMLEALTAIDELSGPDGQEQLELALHRLGQPIEFGQRASREDIALQVWLANPALLKRVHSQHRLTRLTRFECFGSNSLPENRPPFHPPGEKELQALSEALDAWFARHQRGRNTTRVDLGLVRHSATAPDLTEYWFFIRHGDTFARAPSVEEQRTQVLHFRPEKDDVVGYLPALEELRVNARTRGERDLYVRHFGRCLRGSEEWFSSVQTYTLEPLRETGTALLDAAGLDGVQRITLTGLEVALPNAAAERITHQAEDLFQIQRYRLGDAEPIPSEGRLAWATFEFHFAGCPRPRPVEIRTPNVIKVARRCDMGVVGKFLARLRIGVTRKT